LNRALKNINQFLSDEEGVGTIETVLILVVLIGLVLIFKSQIRSLLNTIFEQINSQAGEVY
jgi:Flp pilus assembly pilin Flp